MARVTVVDCVDKKPNRFELILVTARRARDLRSGSAITVERENDKDAVVALREIAEKTISPNDMREMLIHSMQEQVEIDEPEAVAAPLLPQGLRPIPRAPSITAATAALVMQCAHGYSGCIGVSPRGSQEGSRGVALLPVRSVLRIAVTGRQKL